MYVVLCSFNIIVNIWKFYVLYSCVSGLEFLDNGRYMVGSFYDMVIGV